MTPIQPIPSLEDKEAVQVVPTTGDKLRRYQKLVEQLAIFEREQVEIMGAAEARLEAIRAHKYQAECSLLRLEEQDQDERYGVPE